MRKLTLILALSLASAATADEVRDISRSFRLPDGFVAEQIAGPPLTRYPMMIALDEQGRLFIAENAGVNLPRAELDKQRPSSIRMLEDLSGDGRYDRSTVFADGMTYPQGALWHAGSLYVASPPSIWKLTDTDGDGVADRREELVTGFGYTGNAADLHGPFLGPTGRIWWCDGRHGHKITRPDGSLISKGQAARIFSCRTDGSDLQVHCGGGMDNPVEVDFTPRGEVLGTVNLLHPIRGDCLMHWMHGGVYPREDMLQFIAEFKRTGPLLPATIDLGHVAVSGMTRYRGPSFGEGFSGDVFVTEFNTHKVVRVAPKRLGATFIGEKQEFLSSDDQGFHPTDVTCDADGSLLVVDTGGWFLNGCPTSRTAKPEVTGGIYRIRRQDAPTVRDPRGGLVRWSTLDAAGLVELLADPRPVVQQRASQMLAAQGDRAIRPLLRSILNKKQPPPPDNQVIWTLTRIETPAATEALRDLLREPAADILQPTLIALAERHDKPAVPSILALLKHADAAVRREAATSLGRIGWATAVGPILDQLPAPVDRIHEHALIYALIEIGDAGGVRLGLAHESANVRRGALIALDQMHAESLRATDLPEALAAEPGPLKTAAMEIAVRRPEFRGQIVELLQKEFAMLGGDTIPHKSLPSLLDSLIRDDRVQRVVRDALEQETLPAAMREMLLGVIARSGLAKPPDGWHDAILVAVEDKSDRIAQAGFEAARQFGAREIVKALRRTAADTTRPVALRQRALLIAAAHGGTLDATEVAILLYEYSSQTSPVERLAFAEALGKAQLDNDAQLKVAKLLATAGPLELPPLLQAFDHDWTGQGALTAAIESLTVAPGIKAVDRATLVRVLGKKLDITNEQRDKVLSRLVDDKDTRAKLTKLLAELPPGKPEGGVTVFRSVKAACAACHQVRGEGGTTGPDLTTVAARRSREDLLEAIILPSLSLVRGYETFLISTTAGQTHQGFIARQTADKLILRVTADKEVAIDRAEIDQIKPSSKSIMPDGLEAMMNRNQLADLLAYLMTLK